MTLGAEHTVGADKGSPPPGTSAPPATGFGNGGNGGVAAPSFPSIDLKSLQGCQAELEACCNGLAWLDHLWGMAVDALSEAEDVWATVESDAAKAARDDAPSAATATEIRGLITAYVNRTPSARKAKDKLTEAKNERDKLERWMRTAEKRLSAAQTAARGHDALGRYGGGA
jgi:hypothetical protein